MDTPAGAASNENKFVAAVMLVELDGDATDIKTSSNDDIPVYAHGDGSVPRLQVDEEDEIEIEFYNLRGGHRGRERITRRSAILLRSTSPHSTIRTWSTPSR